MIVFAKEYNGYVYVYGEDINKELFTVSGKLMGYTCHHVVVQPSTKGYYKVYDANKNLISETKTSDNIIGCIL